MSRRKSDFKWSSKASNIFLITNGNKLEKSPRMSSTLHLALVHVLAGVAADKALALLA